MNKKSAVKKEKEHDSQAAFVCGEAFQRLAEEIIPRIGAVKEKSSQAMSNELGDVVACATNLGFAIELYLKALLIHLDLRVPQEHHFKVLYDCIPQSISSIIESVYDTALKEDVLRLRGRVSFTIAKGPVEEPQWDDYKPSLALPDLLERSGNLFQSWRYIFEFTQPQDSPYQFHQFEYGLLRCAAETIRVEAAVRLRGMGEVTPPGDESG